MYSYSYLVINMDRFVNDLFDTPRMEALLDLQESLSSFSTSQSIDKPINAKMCESYRGISLRAMADMRKQNLSYFSNLYGYSSTIRQALEKGLGQESIDVRFILPTTNNSLDSYMN